ncbi:MAG: ATP F0F1 synthase subunit B [Pseudomonadota bacterium]
MHLLFLASASGEASGFSFDASFWALVGLILFLALLGYLGVHKTIGGALDKRAEDIRDQLDDARQQREEAQMLLASFQKKRREAEEEAEGIRAAAKREAKAIQEDAERKTQEFITRRTAMAEQKIAQAELDAINEVKAAAVDRAVAAAASIISDRASGAKADDLIKASIAQVKERMN